ncbi:MAG: hypothetical protein AB1428_02630 [Bacteroidota bacterium]
MLWKFLLLVPIIPLLQVQAQPESEVDESAVIARVGPRSITARDLLERIDLMPWPGKDRPGSRDSAAIRATLSLVAEKLLSLEATSIGIGLDSGSTERFESLERALARDALYRQEVAARVALNDEEIALAMKRLGAKLRLALFAVGSEADAHALVRQLRKRTADAPRITVLQQDTVTITFGELAEAHEDIAYALSHPFEARASFTRPSGWLILQLLDRERNSDFLNLNMEERQAAAQKALRKRKEATLASAYFVRMASGAPMRMDSLLFQRVADTLLAVIRREREAHRKGAAFGLLEEDVEGLLRSFRQRLHEPFITHGGDTITLGQTVGAMRFHPVQFRSLGWKTFVEDLHSAMITVAEAELVSSHAMQQHYNAHTDVRRDLQAWIESSQTNELVSRFLDSLSARRMRDTIAGQLPVEPPHTSPDDPLNRYIGRLASKYGVTIDFLRVKQLKVLPVNVVTRRYLGFGGTLPAVPLLPHLWEWYEAWDRAGRSAP